MHLGSQDLSIVIPAYNEERRLPRTLDRITAFLKSIPLKTEIIVVDDGSSDRTAQVVAGFQEQDAAVRLVSNGINRGKGFSVRHGMLQARGEFALFTDADLSTPIEEVSKLLEPLFEDRCDVAIGSRSMDRSLIEAHQPAIREWAGFCFNYAVCSMMGIDFSDTQCGFKAFRTEAARIVFEQQRIERFGFDPEILFLAKRHGLRTEEVGVRWSHDSATKVNVAVDGTRMVIDLLLIRKYAMQGFYPRARAVQPVTSEAGRAW